MRHRAILRRMAFSLEIRCTACNRLALARIEPVYEDFRKVAEAFVCTACGHRYPSREKTPFVDASGRPRVFSDADKPETVKVFKSDERRRSCAWCRHFIVNPFCQRCGLSNRTVEATDVCARFLAKPEIAPAAAGASGSSAVTRFDALFRNDPPAVTSAVKKAEPLPAPATATVAATLQAPPAAVPVVKEPERLPAPKTAAVAATPKTRVAKPRLAKKAPAAPAKKPVGRPRKTKAE